MPCEYHTNRLQKTSLRTLTTLSVALEALAKFTSPFMKAKAYQKGVVTMDYNYRITGQIIGRIRTQRGMSQEVLSGLSGVARSHLAMIETGSKNANVDTIWRIAEALDMKLSDLIRLIEDEHERSIGKRK